MEFLIAIVIGLLTTAGVYLMLRRSFMRLLLGFVLLGQAANLVILTAGGLGPGTSPIIHPHATTLPPGHPDALPQALILTAIVIGFATVAFAMVLLKKASEATGTDDFDALDTTES